MNDPGAILAPTIDVEHVGVGLVGHSGEQALAAESHVDVLHRADSVPVQLQLSTELLPVHLCMAVLSCR